MADVKEEVAEVAQVAQMAPAQEVIDLVSDDEGEEAPHQQAEAAPGPSNAPHQQQQTQIKEEPQQHPPGPGQGQAGDAAGTSAMQAQAQAQVEAVGPSSHATNHAPAVQAPHVSARQESAAGAAPSRDPQGEERGDDEEEEEEEQEEQEEQEAGAEHADEAMGNGSWQGDAKANPLCMTMARMLKLLDGAPFPHEAVLRLSVQGVEQEGQEQVTVQKNGSAAHLYVSAASLAFIRGHGKRTYKLLTPGAVPVLKLDLVPKVGKHKPVAASAPQPRTCKQTKSKGPEVSMDRDNFLALFGADPPGLPVYIKLRISNAGSMLEGEHEVKVRSMGSRVGFIGQAVQSLPSHNKKKRKWTLVSAGPPALLQLELLPRPMDAGKARRRRGQGPTSEQEAEEEEGEEEGAVEGGEGEGGEGGKEADGSGGGAQRGRKRAQERVGMLRRRLFEMFDGKPPELPMHATLRVSVDGVMQEREQQVVVKPNGTASPHVCVVAEDARLIHEHGLRGRTWTLVSRGPPLPVLQLDLGSRQATSYKKRGKQPALRPAAHRGTAGTSRAQSSVANAVLRARSRAPVGASAGARRLQTPGLASHKPLLKRRAAGYGQGPSTGGKDSGQQGAGLARVGPSVSQRAAPAARPVGGSQGAGGPAARRTAGLQHKGGADNEAVAGAAADAEMHDAAQAVEQEGAEPELQTPARPTGGRMAAGGSGSPRAAGGVAAAKRPAGSALGAAAGPAGPASKRPCPSGPPAAAAGGARLADGLPSSDSSVTLREGLPGLDGAAPAPQQQGANAHGQAAAAAAPEAASSGAAAGAAGGAAAGAAGMAAAAAAPAAPVAPAPAVAAAAAAAAAVVAPSGPVTWGVQEVANWLLPVKDAALSDGFARERIDGEALQELYNLAKEEKTKALQEQLCAICGPLSFGVMLKVAGRLKTLFGG